MRKKSTAAPSCWHPHDDLSGVFNQYSPPIDWLHLSLFALIKVCQNPPLRAADLYFLIKKKPLKKEQIGFSPNFYIPAKPKICLVCFCCKKTVHRSLQILWRQRQFRLYFCLQKTRSKVETKCKRAADYVPKSLKETTWECLQWKMYFYNPSSPRFHIIEQIFTYLVNVQSKQRRIPSGNKSKPTSSGSTDPTGTR